MVTVVIPCYLQERYLPDAIDSVVSQSYRQREIIVVDDGSDDVRRVADAYAEVQVVRQENRGLGAARNTGVGAAKGEAIVFLDSDDKLLPNALQIGVEHLDSNPALGFVAGLTRLVSEDGTAIPTAHRARPQSEQYVNLLKCNITTGIHAVMFRRAAIIEAGGFDTTGRFAGVEDYDLYLRIVRKWPILYHDNVLGEYRQHNASMSRNYAMMMRSAIALLTQQSKSAHTSTEVDAAQVGISVFKDYYTDLIIHRIKVNLKRFDWPRIARDLWDVAAIHPLGFLKFVSTPMYRSLAQVTDEIAHISGTDADAPLSPIL
jgi:glycosyltransferase involved in cell wall biosynthesis